MAMAGSSDNQCLLGLGFYQVLPAPLANGVNPLLVGLRSSVLSSGSAQDRPDSQGGDAR